MAARAAGGTSGASVAVDDARKNAKLVVRSESGHRYEYPLNRDRVTIGRSPDCLLIVDDQFVSRLHATIERRGDSFVLVDEGSRNGTLLAGKPLQEPHTLANQEEFHVGNTLLRYVEEQPSEMTAILEPGALSAPADAWMRVDDQTWEVWVNGEKIEPRLSPLEFRLLSYLYHHTGAVCTRADLGREVWGEGGYTHDMLHHLAHRLKRRLAVGRGGGNYVVTVPGVGYKLVAPE